MVVVCGARIDIILPNSRKRGAPGGWVTSNSFEQAINSPQSQKLAVGATVNR